MIRKTYKGLIKHLDKNKIFVFGSNHEGRHGLGAAKFAKDPNLIVFTPIGAGPIDILVLNIKTGEYTAYDVKTQNYRKNGWKIVRARTGEQKRLGVKILNFDPESK